MTPTVYSVGRASPDLGRPVSIYIVDTLRYRQFLEDPGFVTNPLFDGRYHPSTRVAMIKQMIIKAIHRLYSEAITKLPANMNGFP